jgi:hypothetical protein
MDGNRWEALTDPFALLECVRDQRFTRKLRLFNLALADGARRHLKLEKRWQRFRPAALALADGGGDRRVVARWNRAREAAFADVDYPWTGFLEVHDISWLRDAPDLEWLVRYAGWDLAYHCSELLPEYNEKHWCPTIESKSLGK